MRTDDGGARSARHALVSHALRRNPVLDTITRTSDPRTVGHCVFHGGVRSAVCAVASAWCSGGAEPRAWRTISIPRAPNAIAYATPHHVEVDLDSVARTHTHIVVAWLLEMAASREVLRGVRVVCVHSAHRADRATLARVAASCVLVATTVRPDAAATRDLPGPRFRVPASIPGGDPGDAATMTSTDAGLAPDETIGVDFARVAQARDCAAAARVLADLDSAIVRRPACEERLIRAAARALRAPANPPPRRRAP